MRLYCRLQGRSSVALPERPAGPALVCRGGVCTKRFIYRIMRAEVPAVVLFINYVFLAQCRVVLVISDLLLALAH